VSGAARHSERADAPRERPAGRVAALDLGSKRIGVAYSDSGRTIASPWGTIERSGDVGRDRTAIVDAVREIEVSVVVVGLPLSLSGGAGPAARAALEEAEELRAALEPLGVAVETADERFTTTEAQRGLTASGRNAKASRQLIDSAAAMVLLQAWLDRDRA
jgi:putative Holliday junction resolvase